MDPSLTYHDIRAAIDWLEEAFGLDGRYLDEIVAVVRFGGRTT